MSSAGHILDMIKRQKANRELQKQLRQAFKKDALIHTTKIEGNTFNYEKYPPKNEEQIQRNRLKTLLKISKENTLIWIKTIVTILVLLGLILVIIL